MSPVSQPTEISGWKGLFGCLGGGLLVLGLVGGIIWKVSETTRDKTGRITSEFLEPWFDAARDGRMEEAWATLTTDHYRAKYTKEAVAATYREAIKKFGPPRSASVVGVAGTKELLSGRPGYQRVGTRWVFGEDREIYLIFELVDEEGRGFRVDHASPGSFNRTATGYIPPEGTPEGPW